MGKDQTIPVTPGVRRRVPLPPAPSFGPAIDTSATPRAYGTEADPYASMQAPPRKRHPVTTGCLDYFPDAIKAVAECSMVANEQHNPGEPMHWSRGKSDDHADCLVRHLIERGAVDTDGIRHTAKVAWRALALLQLEVEKIRDTTVMVMRADQLSDDDVAEMRAASRIAVAPGDDGQAVER